MGDCLYTVERDRNWCSAEVPFITDPHLGYEVVDIYWCPGGQGLAANPRAGRNIYTVTVANMGLGTSKLGGPHRADCHVRV